MEDKVKYSELAEKDMDMLRLIAASLGIRLKDLLESSDIILDMPIED